MSTPDEETARAHLYALLAELFYASPDAGLLARLRAQTADPDAATPLDAAWRGLLAIIGQHDDDALRQEYDRLFGGVGKPAVYLFGSHYLSGFLNDRPVVRLRDSLQELGLARDPGVTETEDHVACLFDVMRHLIVDGERAAGGLAAQQRFFRDHVHPWIEALCDELTRHPEARFYAGVGELTRQFIRVEAQGFDMLE